MTEPPIPAGRGGPRVPLPLLLFPLPLFFASGFTGLVYEVTWTRMFTVVFGNTTHAVSAVLAAFMGGLAAGSYFIGKAADRHRHRLKLLAGLELGVALSALVIPALVDRLELVYGPVYRAFPSSPGLLAATSLALAFVILLVPTFLMGGTLPVLARVLVRSEEQSGGRVGVLYAVNTLGATAGCFVTGFWLLEAFGVASTIHLAVLVNVLLAACFFVLGLRYDLPEQPRELPPLRAERRDAPLEAPNLAAVTAAVALAGFVALALEVLWTRLLVFNLYTTVYAFAIMLTTFLAGLGLGSLAYSAIERMGLVRHPYRVFGLLQAAIGLAGLASIRLFGSLEAISPLHEALTWRAQVTQKLLAAGLIMIVPTLLMGAAFPLACRVALGRLERIGSSLGRLYAASTVGSILGSLLTGFLLVRVAGTQTSIVLVSLLALGVGTAVWITQPRGTARRRAGWIPLLGCWAGAAALLVTTPADALFRYYNVGQQRINGRVEILHADEGVECITTVHRFPDGRRVLATGSMNVAGTGLTLRTTQKLQAHVPLLLHHAPRAVLQVGFGSGETSHILTSYDTERVDVVEISQGVLDAAAEYFSDINHDVVRHPKFRAIVMDGANYLALTDRRYDLILNDSIWPYYAGNSGLYTREYFADGRARLNPGGIMTSWLPVDMPPESLKSLLNTFRSVFPDVSLWLAATHFNRHALLVGSVTPHRIDLPVFFERFERYARQDLADVYLDDPLWLLDAFRTDGDGIARWAEGAPLHTLDRPVLEFAPRTKTPTDWTQVYNLLVLDETTVFPRLEHLEAFGGPEGELATRLRATQRATKLVLQGLIKRERQMPDFARQFELALREEPAHPGARLLLREREEWTVREQADLGALAFADLLLVGEQLLNHDNPARAAAALTRAIELDPGSSQARHNLALAYLRMGRPESASSELDELVRRDAHHAPAYKLRGTVHSALGQLEPAIQDFSRAIELDPRDAESFVNRGLARARHGAVAGALEDLDRAIAIEPALADAYYARAGLRESSGGAADLALADYSRAIELDPAHVDALYDRAMLQAQDGRYASAIEDFTRALALSPDQADAYYYRGLAHQRSGNAAQAREDFERAGRLDPAYRQAPRASGSG